MHRPAWPLLPVALAVIVQFGAGCHDWGALDVEREPAGPLPCPPLLFVPPTPIDGGELRHAVVDRGPVQILEVHACANSQADGAHQRPIRVVNRYEAPDGMTQATVVLNGWDLHYLADVDHAVSKLIATIANVELEQRPAPKGAVLKWDVIGALGDEESAEPFRFCYVYLLITWDPTRVDATMAESFLAPSLCQTGQWDRANPTSAYVPRYLGDWRFLYPRKVALMPRGLALRRWNSPVPGVAYGIRQAVQAADQLQRYVGTDGQATSIAPDAGIIDHYFVTWESVGSLGFYFGMGDVTGAIVGNDVTAIQLPAPSQSGDAALKGVRTPQDVGTHVSRKIQYVPFEYAVPLLSGWNLQYLKDRHHIQRAAVQIDNARYPPSSGELTYDVEFHLYDHARSTDAAANVNVTVLGLDRHGVPDLVARSPNLPSFPCLRDENGKLVVNVPNKGDGPAGLSVTKISFKVGGEVLRDTPVVPPGGTVLLQPIDIPPVCLALTGGCQFFIALDFTGQVRELDESNNVGVGVCH